MSDQTHLKSPDPRLIINAVADILRGKRPNVSISDVLNDHPDMGKRLCDYIDQRFVACTLAPSAVEHEGVFWEAIASILVSIDTSQRAAVLDLFFEVQDPKTVYHVLARVLREVFFPSMLEPVLLQKIQSDDPRVRANAVEMDYFLFQARSHFSMSPAGRAQFNALAARAGSPAA
jgi:hypothetical protein